MACQRNLNLKRLAQKTESGKKRIFNKKSKNSEYVEQTAKVSGNLMLATSNARTTKIGLRAIFLHLPLINYSFMDNSQFA